MPESITVNNRVTITSPNNEEYTRAKHSKIGDEDINKYVTEEHSNIFNVIRAKDGDETTLSRKDLELMAKDKATLNAFGYTVEHKGDVYSLKSANGKVLTFDFETLTEKAARHWNEKVVEPWDKFKAERAEKKEAKKLENAKKKAEKFNKKYNGHAEVEIVGKKYKLTVNEGSNLHVIDITDLNSKADKFIDGNEDNFLGTGIESVHTGKDSYANDSAALNTKLNAGTYYIEIE